MVIAFVLHFASTESDSDHQDKKRSFSMNDEKRHSRNMVHSIVPWWLEYLHESMDVHRRKIEIALTVYSLCAEKYTILNSGEIK
jgi:hypothetical protein